MARSRFRDDDEGTTRREALRGAAKVVAGLSVGAQVLAAGGAPAGAATRRVARAAAKPGYGPLVANGPELSLPKGFRAIPFGSAGVPMTDGHATPGFHDGATVTQLADGKLRLLRNHEGYDTGRALGRRGAYDRVAQGGVTSTIFDPVTERPVASALVLNGTDNNCNGGPTPWGSWLSCEESTVGRHEGFEREHGYVFEVPFDATGPVDPVPIKAMGRFEHEACAIDPATGIVYMTEDNGDPGDGFYRYLPDHPGQLHRGGTLQMLCVEGRSRYDTTKGQRVGRALRCEWVTIRDPDPSDAEARPQAVYAQGRERGAARFLGLEGAEWARGAVHFVASESGDAEEGQIWRYTPQGLDAGRLELLYESRSKRVLDQPDALTVSPRGGVVVCEDGDGEDVDGGTNYLRCLTPEGRIETFARVDAHLHLRRYDDEAPRGAVGRSELSGVSYSPDGRWLFFAVQYPGRSYAVTGPWELGWL
jgi:uncharacterized protein